MNDISINSQSVNNSVHVNSHHEHDNEIGYHQISLYELFILFIFMSLASIGIYYLADPATLPIKQVRIEGDFRQLSTSELQTLVKHKVVGGFFNIDVASLRHAVMAEPWVNDVSVHRVWPNGLRVSVQEQIAVARWKTSSLLNEVGDQFSPHKDSFPQELPILDGPEGTQKLLMEKYRTLDRLFSTHDMQLLRLQLNERRSWMFELNDNLRVIIGRTDFNDRVARFFEYVPKGLGPKLAKAEQIDMRYTNGFAVRWKQDDMLFNEDIGT